MSSVSSTVEPMTLPAIDELILQRQDMLLLDEVTDYGGDFIEAEVTLRSRHPLAAAEGMPAFVGLELMAQAVSAFSGLELRQQNQPPRIGLLLGARKFEALVPYLPLGEPLRVRAVLSLRDDSGLGVFDCTIRGAQRLLAQARVKGYMPQDIETFLEEHARG